MQCICFTDEESEDQGGVIFAKGMMKLEVLSCSFKRTKAKRAGGAIHASDLLALTISSCVFEKCEAQKSVICYRYYTGYKCHSDSVWLAAWRCH